MNTAIYLRQSQARDGDDLAIERQLAECQRLCDQRGYDVIEVVQDNNVSASRGERVGYQHVLDLIDARTIDVVVVLRLDRLLRKVTDLEALIDLSERTGVQIVTVQGDLDLSNSSGRLLGRILASVARSEVETKSERQKLANAQAARAGKPHGSRRPYGYEKDLVTINKAEAKVLREMARRFIAGHSSKEIAYWLNERGHTTTTGKLWYPITVRNMMRKKRYAGIREYEGAEYVGTWKPIFDSTTCERLQLAMKLRTHADMPPVRRYLLTGLLYCGKCGTPLTGTSIKNSWDHKRDRLRPGGRIYKCRVQGDTSKSYGCGGVRRNADALDDYATRQLFEHLAGSLLIGSDSGDGLATSLRNVLDDQVAQRNRLDHLVDDYATGVLTKQQFTRAKATAEAELNTIEAEIDRFNRERLAIDLPHGATIEQAWVASDSDEWKRSVLALFMKRIEVSPGVSKPWYTLSNGTRAKFDPSLILIEWAA